MTVARLILVVTGVLLLPASLAHAHGGFYQTPRTPSGVPTAATGPGTGPLPAGTPTGIPSFGPAVTGRKHDDGPPAVTPGTSSLPPAINDPRIRGSAWEVWWSLNKERYLWAAAVPGGAATPRRRPDAGDGRPGDGPTRQELIDALLESLADTSADVRASSALALGRAAEPRAASSLRKLATTDDVRDVRDVAVVALGLIGRDAEIPFLHGRMVDAESPVRSRALAALALGMVGGEEASSLLTLSLDPTARSAANAPSALIASGLVALGAAGDESALPALREVAHGNSLRPVVRSFAVLSIGRLGDRESLEPLVKLLLQAPEPYLRQSAAIAVGHLATIEDVRAVNALIHAAKSDRDLGTQNLSVLALGEIWGEPVRVQIEKLFAAASDNDKAFRAIALGLQGDLAAAPALRAALERDGHEESLQAAYSIALGLLGDVDAAPLLVAEVGKTRRFWSPGYASLGLALMGARDATDAVAQRLGKATDARQKATLAVALGLLGDARGPAALEKSVREQDTIYEASIATMALGALRHRESAPLLLGVLRGEDGRPDVLRAAAASALGRILDEREVPGLVTLLDQQNFVVELDSLAIVRALLSHR